MPCLAIDKKQALVTSCSLYSASTCLWLHHQARVLMSLISVARQPWRCWCWLFWCPWWRVSSSSWGCSCSWCSTPSRESFCLVVSNMERIWAGRNCFSVPYTMLPGSQPLLGLLSWYPVFEGILPKGPYLPCISMAGRALLAGYHHCIVNSLRLSDAYMHQKTNHHWFR